MKKGVCRDCSYMETHAAANPQTKVIQRVDICHYNPGGVLIPKASELWCGHFNQKPKVQQ